MSDSPDPQESGSFHDQLANLKPDSDDPRDEVGQSQPDDHVVGSESTDFAVDGGDPVEDEESDEPGDPSVDPELLELHMELESQGKTAADMDGYNAEKED